MPSSYSPINESSFNENAYDAEALLGNKEESYQNRPAQHPYPSEEEARRGAYPQYPTDPNYRSGNPQDPYTQSSSQSQASFPTNGQPQPVYPGNAQTQAPYPGNGQPQGLYPEGDNGSQTGQGYPNPSVDTSAPHVDGTKHERNHTSLSRLPHLLRDSRMVMFLGLVFIVLAGYALIVTISYFANIGNDQSAMLGGDYSPEMIKNVGGPFGAWIAHTLLYNWFGLGSFLLIYYVGVCGLSMLKVYRPRFWDLTLRCLLTTVALSIVLGFITFEISSPIYWGGRHGYLLTERLSSLCGFWGVLGLSIIMAGLVVILYLAELRRIITTISTGIKAHRERQKLRKEQRDARRQAELNRMAAEEAQARAEAEAQTRAREEEQNRMRAEYAARIAAEQNPAPDIQPQPEEGAPLNVGIGASSEAQTALRPSQQAAVQPSLSEAMAPSINFDASQSESSKYQEPEIEKHNSQEPIPVIETKTAAPVQEIDDKSVNDSNVPSAGSQVESALFQPTEDSDSEPEQPLFASTTDFKDDQEAQRPLFVAPPLFADSTTDNDKPTEGGEKAEIPIKIVTPTSETHIKPEAEAPTPQPAIKPEAENSTLQPSVKPEAENSTPQPSFKPEAENSTPQLSVKPETEPPSPQPSELRVAPTAEEVLASAPYNPRADLSNFKFPALDLLRPAKNSGVSVDVQEMELNKHRITETLKNYGVTISHIEATIGPTVTLYEIIPADGVRTRSVKSLGDDLQLSLAALGVRIIAPIPAKGTIGIEVPNKDPQTVSMRSVLDSDEYRNTKMELPMALGKTISNEIFMADLAKMPHLLVAGATGMGKSVGLNAIITSLLYKKHPSELKFVLIDPKRVELSLYRRLERHYLAALPDEDAIITDMSKVVNVLNSLCIEMDNRLTLLEQAGARNIMEYNEKFKARRLNPDKHRFLPYIVLIIDEFADLIIRQGKEIENPVSRLAAVARAAGIHLIIATQRPTVNVITGGIKLNIPGRIAFRVTQGNDSRTILDQLGANQLIGRGDMLFSINGKLERVQCAFIDTPEVSDICDFISEQTGFSSPYELPEYAPEGEGGSGGSTFGERDDLLDECARWIVQTGTASTSSLQRRYSIGYNRAGKIMDQLEAAGVVGPSQGGKPRQVLVDSIMLEHILANN